MTFKIFEQCLRRIKVNVTTKVNDSKYAPTPNSPQQPHPSYESPLYIILPYFNFCHFQRRKQLFLEFVERYKATTGIAIVIVESSLQGEAFDLPNPIPGVFAHFRVITQDPIWLKENLINIGVSRLPQDWRMMAWVDADITFMNENWVNQTKAILTNRPLTIVQLFKTAANMGPCNEVYKLDNGFAWSILSAEQGSQKTEQKKYTDFHPGFAWAVNRLAYDYMGGLVDWAILGSGDRHMALALVGSAVGSAPGNIDIEYKNKLIDFENKCKKANLCLGYIQGTVLHHWHGRLADRKYGERWNILINNKYNPLTDITRSHRCGLIQLTEEGRRMKQEIRQYFEDRNEDNTNMV